MVALASLAPGQLAAREPQTPQTTNLRKSQSTRGSKRLKRQQQQRSPLLACHEDPSFIYHQHQHLARGPELGEPASPAQANAKTLDSNASHHYNSGASGDSLLGSSSHPSSCSSGSSGPRRNLSPNAEAAGSDYASASPGCISALDYWHLNSESPAPRRHWLQAASVQSPQEAACREREEPREEQQRTDSDSVYLDDGQVFHNLLLMEGAELRRRQAQLAARLERDHWRPLEGRRRHSLLSWMLKVCEHQLCQDEVFPLASQILDKFLLLQPAPDFGQQQQTGGERQEEDEEEEDDDDQVFRCDERELERRQLYLFAACSLLLAAKLRQTPRLAVQSLVEFSRLELPVELARAEILEGELLLLARLKWDLASLVTPNDFLVLLLRKCRRLLAGHEQAGKEQPQTRSAPRCDEARVRRHTQTLLELCLMDSQLSQYPPSILAMSSMAVAIDGLSVNERTCWRLKEIVTQIYEITHKVNELKSMIDVALKIEKYVQTLLKSTHND